MNLRWHEDIIFVLKQVRLREVIPALVEGMLCSFGEGKCYSILMELSICLIVDHAAGRGLNILVSFAYKDEGEINLHKTPLSGSPSRCKRHSACDGDPKSASHV